MRNTRLLSLVLVAAAACSDSHAGHDDAPSLTVTAFGEELALDGFAFPPTPGAEVAFVDGWEVKLERFLVTLDKIVLADNADLSPTDQSQIGPVVAQADGPWAVDMTKAGAATEVATAGADLRLMGGEGPTTGRGGVEDKSLRLVRFGSLNRAGRPFDTSTRYAFGYDAVVASQSAKRINVDAGDADYAEMVAKGWTVLYVGTATFKGTSCKSSSSTYDWNKLPKTVKFRFGLATPATFTNCQNPDLTGKPFDGEEKQRGIQLAPQGPTFAQITFHTDHAFWDTVDHEAAEPYFDQYAAHAKNGVVTLEDLQGVDFTAFKDKDGVDLPWRSCIDGREPRAGTRKFDPGSVSIDPKGAPDRSLRDYRDYVAYVSSTMGHLNADGLCAVTRRYASPR